jgi:hypothetical protein
MPHETPVVFVVDDQATGLLSEARNASAEENASTLRPSALSRTGKDLGTDSSSSTTDASG